jgi:hypothetical protein
MSWILAHHLCIGILADTLSFLGACILARDAFLRLGELKSERVDEAFRRQFPKLNLTDAEWKRALVSMRWTLAGFVLLVLGFLSQLLVQIAAA